MVTIAVKTARRQEMVDVTGRLRQALEESGVRDGLMVAYVPHTTAGITVNENADPSVPRDLLGHLARLVPAGGPFEHAEGNSDAHIQASLVGSSVTVIIENGRLALGAWQGIFFCEFDGPRRRELYLEVIPRPT